MKTAFKPVILAFSFFALLFGCRGGRPSLNPPRVSTHGWTWVSGSNTINQVSTYGTRGKAAHSNVPGARELAVSWIDSRGNLWLFGGQTSPFDLLNDLWKYAPKTHEWTWVSGSNAIRQKGIYGTKGKAAPSNVPGGRSLSVSWIDPRGNLWLFGGWGYDSSGYCGYLNDLWKYNPKTREWTWVSGSTAIRQKGIYGTKGKAAPSNVPGERSSAVSWVDSRGKLWLFGGWGSAWYSHIRWLNDLWKYDPKTHEWTWVSGSNTQDQAGVYGIQGTTASSNVPGGRKDAVSWIDPSGNLWLFGGDGYDSAGTRHYLNDLWKYAPKTHEWTWVSGSSFVNRMGDYGIQGTAAPSNVPGARCHATSWNDSSGNLWLFGGFGNIGLLNDLWKYDPKTHEWTWVSGSSFVNRMGDYGIQGTTASSNVPGGRSSAVSWIDSRGRLWLFGGSGSDSAGMIGCLNDLWYYTR